MNAESECLCQSFQWRIATETKMRRIPPSPPTLTPTRAKWWNNLSLSCLKTFCRLYTQIIMFSILMNAFIGAGPKAGQRFLQNAVTAEEERSKDLSERCQILHRREYDSFITKYRHVVYEETVLMCLVSVNKQHLDQAATINRPLQESPRNPCSWRTMRGRSSWREEGTKASGY